MTNVDQILRGIGGVAHVRNLVSAGTTKDRVEDAAAAGTVIRVRRGIYAARDAPADVVEAARLGGRLAGSSAARMHGLWARPGHPLTVEVSGYASTLPALRTPTRVLWSGFRYPLRDALGVVSLVDCLVQVIRTELPIHSIATLDSAIHRGLVNTFDLAELELRLPLGSRHIVHRANGLSESGTESVLRILLEQVGITAVPQVPIPFTDLDRLDLLVGDCLVIECDSEAHHGGREQRLKDLRRDAELAALGFIVLRFDYQQVMFDPNSVIAAVQRLVDLGLHLRQSR